MQISRISLSLSHARVIILSFPRGSLQNLQPSNNHPVHRQISILTNFGVFLGRIVERLFARGHVVKEIFDGDNGSLITGCRTRIPFQNAVRIRGLKME